MSVYLLIVVDVHELGADGPAIDFLEPLDDLPKGKGLFLKVFREIGFLLKSK